LSLVVPYPFMAKGGMHGAIGISIVTADKGNTVLYMVVIRLHVPRGSKFVPENILGLPSGMGR
jgi:hypothetical protein